MKPLTDIQCRWLEKLVESWVVGKPFRCRDWGRVPGATTSMMQTLESMGLTTRDRTIRRAHPWIPTARALWLILQPSVQTKDGTLSAVLMPPRST